MAKKKIAAKKAASAKKPKRKAAAPQKKSVRILKRKSAAPQKKRGILKKKKPASLKKSHSPKKIIRRLPSFSELKKETFELDIEPVAQPSHHFAHARMAPEEEIFELPDLPKPEALRAIERKKRIPHAITSVLAGAVLALFSGFVFLTVLSAGEFLSVSISAAIFVGFTIFIYNKLETG